MSFSVVKKGWGATMDLARSIPVMTMEEAYNRVYGSFEVAASLPSKRYKIEESEGSVVAQASKVEKRLSRLSQYPPLTYSDVNRERRHYFHGREGLPMRNSREANKLRY